MRARTHIETDKESGGVLGDMLTKENESYLPSLTHEVRS